MTTSKSTNNSYITLHPFDSVYTFVFIYLMFNLLSETFVQSIDNFRSTGSFEFFSYSTVVSFFFFFQISRMYYHLKNFESIIQQEGNNHFLEIIPEKTQSIEKVVRIMLAALLVIFSKTVGYSEFTLPFTLFVCFVLLIIWDLLVIKGLISILPTMESLDNDKKKSYNQALETGKAFFYWQQSDLKSLNLCENYFDNHKFKERLCGLFASITAFFCIKISNGLPIFLLSFFAIGILLYSIRGKWKINQLNSDTVLVELLKNIVRPFYMPVLNLVNELKNNKMDNNDKKTWLKYIIVLLIAILLFLVWKNWDNPKTIENKTTTIKIATSKNLWCAMTLIALDRHYFEQEGLKPEVSYQAAGRQNMDALLGGSVDFANVVETNIAYQALNNTTDLKIHSRIVSANDYTILTTKKSNILEPQDFNNKSISFSQATGAESFLFWFMEHNDLLNKNIRLVPLQPAGLVDNFKGGGTDAVTAWEPFVSTIQNQKKDLGKLFRADSLGFKGIMTVATKETWASNNKNIVTAYNKAMQKASMFLKDSTSNAQIILSRETGIPVETIVNSWVHFNYYYSTNIDKEKLLIADVIRRIKIMIPDKKNIKEQNIESYFK